MFELAGEDKPGLLSETTRLLTANGCNVRSAAVSPHRLAPTYRTAQSSQVYCTLRFTFASKCCTCACVRS